MRRNGRRNTNSYCAGQLKANCPTGAVHDLMSEPSGVKAPSSPATNAPHELFPAPRNPLLAADVAFGLQPLPHPLTVQSSLLVSVAYDHQPAILQLQFGHG